MTLGPVCLMTAFLDLDSYPFYFHYADELSPKFHWQFQRIILDTNSSDNMSLVWQVRNSALVPLSPSHEMHDHDNIWMKDGHHINQSYQPSKEWFKNWFHKYLFYFGRIISLVGSILVPFIVRKSITKIYWKRIKNHFPR